MVRIPLLDKIAYYVLDRIVYFRQKYYYERRKFIIGRNSVIKWKEMVWSSGQHLEKAYKGHGLLNGHFQLHAIYDYSMAYAPSFMCA